MLQLPPDDPSCRVRARANSCQEAGTPVRSVPCFKRRIHTEEKPKVVAVPWGTELLQFLAALTILHQDDLKNRLICPPDSSTRPRANQRVRQIVLLRNGYGWKEI